VAVKLKMHKRMVMGAWVTTACQRDVAPEQIAAFDEGVTCKQCLAAIQWSKDHNREVKQP
jgi:hypothetical protein